MNRVVSADVAIEQNALNQEFIIGRWRVQPDLNRLQRRDGSLCRHLEPRLMHLLCYLAASDGRVLSRDELVKALWPRVVVNENSLTRAVSELRKNLAGDGQDIAYIETIPKKGYRLLSTIESPTEPKSGRGNLPAPLLPPGRPRQLLIAALCLGLVADFWFSTGTAPEPALLEEPVLLADEVMSPEFDFFGAELTLSKAPDLGSEHTDIEAPVVFGGGNRYAFIKYDHLGSTIFLGSLDEMTEPVAVFNSAGKLINLAWSPIGNSLLFARQMPITSAALFTGEQDEAQLYSLDLDSLTLKRLVEAPVAPDAKSSGELSLT